MSIEDIQELIDKIHERLYDLMKETGHNRQDITLVLNEDSCAFLNAYFRQYHSQSNATHMFGMKVMKMKAKGFVFIYE